MNGASILEATRYDRLKMFYSNLSLGPFEFKDYGDNRIPLQVEYDKHSYRKYLRVPFTVGPRKQYYFSLYDRYYQFYRSDSNFYFIDNPNVSHRMSKPFKNKLYEDFYCSMAHSYIAMAFYEMIKWLTGSRRCYKLNIEDEVFNPIFDFPQWKMDDYDCKLILTMHPIKDDSEKSIRLSIFK